MILCVFLCFAIFILFKRKGIKNIPISIVNKTTDISCSGNKKLLLRVPFDLLPL